eukprot:7311432-Prymnesium_polylepis.1
MRRRRQPSQPVGSQSSVVALAVGVAQCMLHCCSARREARGWGPRAGAIMAAVRRLRCARARQRPRNPTAPRQPCATVRLPTCAAALLPRGQWRALQRRLRLRRVARNRYEVDAVPVAAAVGDVVPQVRAVNGDALAVRQDAHALPVDLRITARRPTVLLALDDKLFEGAAHRRAEEEFARVGVEEVERSRALALRRMEVAQQARREKVARTLCKPPCRAQMFEHGSVDSAGR